MRLEDQISQDAASIATAVHFLEDVRAARDSEDPEDILECCHNDCHLRDGPCQMEPPFPRNSMGLVLGGGGGIRTVRAFRRAASD